MEKPNLKLTHGSYALPGALQCDSDSLGEHLGASRNSAEDRPFRISLSHSSKLIQYFQPIFLDLTWRIIKSVSIGVWSHVNHDGEADSVVPLKRSVTEVSPHRAVDVEHQNLW